MERLVLQQRGMVAVPAQGFGNKLDNFVETPHYSLATQLLVPKRHHIPRQIESDTRVCVDTRALNVTLKLSTPAPVLSLKSEFSGAPVRWPEVQARSGRNSRSMPFTRAGTGLADEQEQENSEAGLGSVQVPTGTMMVPVMKKGYGAFGGGATLEKSKLDTSQPTTKVAPKLDTGGGGGNIGKGVSFGGGDGGDDGGDDDDYFGEEGDGDDDGDDGFLRRGLIPEVFDREAVEAVLQEWFRTISDLPAGLYRAVQMGLVSSAQVARFMSIDARPTIARLLSRLAPSEFSRAFIGRMMADPAFIFKVVVEQVATVGAVAHWEVQKRKDRLKEEWGIILSNVLTVSACNLAVVWCLSPSRSYGTTAKTGWQIALQKLPNHMFDKSYPLREFNFQARAGSFLYKAAELSLLGSIIGSAGTAAANGFVTLQKKRNPDFQASVPVPTVGVGASAYGAYMGLSGNLRYQLVYGLDRVLQTHFSHIPIAILGTTALRCGNVLLGEPSRLAWLGLDDDSLAQLKARSSAYRRPSALGLLQQKKSVLDAFKGFVEELQKMTTTRRRRVKKGSRGLDATKGLSGDKNDGAREDERAPVRKPRRKVKQRMVTA